ncbi:DUF2142 domain-containing protein [Arcanobacterium haemolyticum]
MEITTHSRFANTAQKMRNPRILAVVCLLGLLSAGFSWIVASPIAGSPDDDFHMGSIWCPRPAGESCASKMVDGALGVQVPEPVALAKECHAFKEAEPASCPRELSNDKLAFTYRYDDGNYPTTYYRFHHLLISHSVADSVILMRTVNFLIAVFLLGTIGWLLRPEHRPAYVFAMLGAWVPMGFYFLTSMNPSAWAITGVFAYATAMYAAFFAEGKRRWGLLACAIIGAFMSFASRGDSAFYIFVVTAALLWAIKIKRSDWRLWSLAGALSIFGCYMMLGGGQANIVANHATVSDNFIGSVLRTTMDLPRYFAGFVSFGYGPGWFDVPLDVTFPLLALFASGSLLMAGFRRGTWRKWMAVLMIAGAMCGIPVLIVAVGSYPHLGPYQPRYMLPLFAVLFFFLFVLSKERIRILDFSQKVVLAGILFIVNSYTLHAVLWRYVSGAQGIRPVNIDAHMHWWWDIPISPMGVWFVGTVGFLIAIVAGMLLSRAPEEKEVLANREVSDSTLAV